MPGWHRELRQNADLQGRSDWLELGIIQEQHPQRCRLFMQWQQLDFPILVDAFNQLGVEVVPLTLGIDEHGIVRERLRSPADVPAFLERRYEGVPAGIPEQHLTTLLLRAHWPTDDADLTRLIDALANLVRQHPEMHEASFAHGVALLRRWESAARRAGDFQAAVDAWQRALDGNPNQYIWRRRIQQYGPQRDKPYPFYDWVPEARREVAGRGESPIELHEPLTRSERAGREPFVARNVLVAPDPDGRIARDDRGLIELDTAVVPPRATPGRTVRLHIALRPNAARDGHWNNESGPTRVWIDPPPGWEVDHPLIDLPPDPTRATSDEVRRAEVELRVPADATGPVEVTGYAVYYACVGADGTCVLLRRDLRVRVEVRAAAD